MACLLLKRPTYVTQRCFLFAVLLWTESFLSMSNAGPSFEKRVQLIKYLQSSNRSLKTVRPIKDGSNSIDITMDLTLSNVIDMDEKYQILTSNVWLRQNWTNEMMVWDPKDWDGLTSLSMDAGDVWTPDIVLYNNVFEDFDGRLDNIKTLVSVFHTGKTTWNAPFVFKTLCKINVKNFPFDKQQCKLKFGSWRYGANELNLWFAQNTANLDDKIIKNGEWNVEGVEVTRNALTYPCCPDVVYPDITFIINIKRRSLFYMFNLIIPNFLIALLAFFSFYIPVECGERISFVMTVLLSMFVFLLLVAESVPPTSEAVPAIGIYFTSSIILVALALVATGLVLKINYLHVHKTSFSPSCRRLLFGKLGPLFGFDESKRFFHNDSVQTSFMEQFKKQIDKTLPFKSSNSSAKVVFHNSHQSKNKEVGRWIPDNEDVDDDCSTTFIMGEIAEQNDCLAQDVHLIAKAVSSHEDDNAKSAECRLAAAIVDRLFMFLFVLVFIVSTVIILVIPYLSKD